MEKCLSPLIECRSVSVLYRRRLILDEFDLTLYPLDVVGVTGPSGAGKTTLLRLVAGLVQPTSGVVWSALNRCIGFATQSPCLLPWRKSWENIAIPLIDAGYAVKSAKQEAYRFLEMMELGYAAEQWPGTLSGGMAKRVSIARALAVRPEVLLLDEPFAGLDDAARDLCIGILIDYIEEHQPAVLHVTHDLKEIHRYATRILRCENTVVSEEPFERNNYEGNRVQHGTRCTETATAVGQSQSGNDARVLAVSQLREKSSASGGH